MKFPHSIFDYELINYKNDYSFLQFLKETIKPPKNLLSPALKNKINLENLVFIIMNENHFQHMRPIGDRLINDKIPFSVIHIFQNSYKKFEKIYPNQIFLPAHNNYINYLRMVIFQWVVLLYTSLSQKPDYNYKKKQYRRVVYKYLKLHYLLKTIFSSFLKDFNGKVILFKAELFIAKTIINEAKKKNIPTYVIQHGLIAEHIMFRNSNADNYLVWSDFFKNKQIKNNVKSKIRSVGNVALDKVFKVVQEKNKDFNIVKKKSLELLFLPNSGMSHTTMENVFESINICVRYAIKNPDVIIKIKEHPSDVNDNVFNYIEKKFGNVNNLNLIDREHEIPFGTNDITIINNSGAGMESAIWGIPLIIISDKLENVHVPFYLDEKIAEFANNDESFEAKVLRIMSENKFYRNNCKKFIKKYFVNRGVVAEKIIEIIL